MAFMKYQSFIVMIIMLMMVSCSEMNQKLTINGQAQGTYYAITYFDKQGRNFRPAIDSILDAFDQSVSLWVPHSILSRVNANDTNVVLDQWFVDLYNKSMEVANNTQGAFDLTVGPLVSAWGFGLENRLSMDSLKVDSLLQFVGYEKVAMKDGHLLKQDPRIRIDFNAIAQGYAVDVLAGYLDAHGIRSFLIDIGGEVFARGLKPDASRWRVGIEKPASSPTDDRQLKAILELKDQALATSGNYRKFFEENGIKYSHTIDPSTGYPVRHSLLSVSVKADDCATADAFATAFMVMGLDKALELSEDLPSLEAYFIYTDGKGGMKTAMTPGMKRLLVEEN